MVARVRSYVRHIRSLTAAANLRRLYLKVAAPLTWPKLFARTQRPGQPVAGGRSRSCANSSGTNVGTGLAQFIALTRAIASLERAIWTHRADHFRSR